MDPWTTDSLMNDPVLNPGLQQVSQQQQQQQPQQPVPQQQPMPPPRPQLVPIPQQPPQQQTSRSKRPRSTSPMVTNKRSKQTRDVPSSAALALQLKDVKTRMAALETLLKISSLHDLNHALGDDGDQVLQALVDIVYESLNYTKQDSSNEEAVFSAKGTWFEPPTAQRQAWARHAQQQLAHPLSPKKSNLLNCILIIFRNLSYVSANARIMNASSEIWSILVGCLYEEHAEVLNEESSSGEANLALHSLSTILNLATQPSLDITGQLRVVNALFNPDSPLPQLGWGGMRLAKRFNVKEDTVDVSPKFIKHISQQYLSHVWSLFSALRLLLVNPKTPRSVLLLALDLLKECLDQVGGVVAIDVKDEEIPTMATICKHLPDDVLQRLVDFLWIPRLGPDALDYINPLHNIVSRVSTLKLKMGYDATVDTDLRDRALDVLVPWLALDDANLAKRLGFTPKHKIRTRLYDAVVPILTTRVGRNDAPVLATHLLKYLAAAPENHSGLTYIQDRMVQLASRDARIAQLAFTHLYKPKQEESSEEESSSESEG